VDFARDRKDAAFLICAESGSADYLMTGDRDFEDAPTLSRTAIVSARQFASAVAPDLLT